MVYEQIRKRKVITGMGCLRNVFIEVEEPRRTYYPSEKAAIWAMKPRNFGYLPNPEKDEHDDQFLLVPDYCWDEELMIELEQARY